ncbi:response regulator [Methanobacterium sp.]|uniref:response regulator n=1 Tax=Methanobacterium sp. TaxID=2164 RepID=UPI003C72F798
MSINILIVEDECIVALDIKQRLESMSYNVIDIASSGESALKVIDNHQIDLVIMDIRLGGKLSGIDTAIQIRNNFDIPIIYSTAYSDFKTHKEIKQTEPYEHLVKPFDDNQLQSAINSLKLHI